MHYNTHVLQETGDWQDVTVKFSGHEIVVREFVSGRNAIKSYRGTGITWEDIQTFTKNFTLERQQVADCCMRWFDNQIIISDIRLENGEKYVYNQENYPLSFDLAFRYSNGHSNLILESVEFPNYFELPISILNQLVLIVKDFQRRFTLDDTESHWYSKWKTSADFPQMEESLADYLKRTIGEEMMEMVSLRTENWNAFHERWGKIEGYLRQSFILQPTELFWGKQRQKSVRIIGLQQTQDKIYTLHDDCEWHLIPSAEQIDLYIKFIDSETPLGLKQDFMRTWNQRRPSPNIVCVDEGSMILHLAFDLRNDTPFETVCLNFFSNYSASLPRSLSEFIHS